YEFVAVEAVWLLIDCNTYNSYMVTINGQKVQNLSGSNIRCTTLIPIIKGDFVSSNTKSNSPFVFYPVRGVK
ncbi:hypothetical protein IJ531_03695, partial [bacterium]|nr:hypothetical protein [bacterium]